MTIFGEVGRLCRGVDLTTYGSWIVDNMAMTEGKIEDPIDAMEIVCIYFLKAFLRQHIFLLDTYASNKIVMYLQRFRIVSLVKVSASS